MLAIDNRTPLPAALVPGLDREGRTQAPVIVKATSRLREGNLALADEQLPLRATDAYSGEPRASSLLHDADYAPQKPGTDVILLGHTWSPAPVSELDVTLAAGP